ncbi:hypothetical protein [Pedobacter duraquae]|nr:hypothetical protein [Pedobacter duraquae]
MVKQYNFLIKCFYCMVLWNVSQNREQRAMYGMTFTIVNMFHALLFVIASNFNIQGNGYLIASLTLVLLYTVYKLNVKYVLKKVSLQPNYFEAAEKERKWLCALGCIFLFGSFIMLGLSGKYFNKFHSR